MPKYHLAVKNDDKNDCRLFFDKENAINTIKRNPSSHYEEREGRAAEYFKEGKLKATVIEGETFADIINSEVLSNLLNNEPFDYIDISFKDSAYVKINGRTFIFIDFKKEEISRFL